MYDYVDGKADWMAYGLPVEGDDGPFLGSLAAEVPTGEVTGTVADARTALEATGAPAVVLVHAGGMAVGVVDREALEGRDGGVALLDVFDPVPSTVRPSVTVAALADGGGGERLVTTSDGRLLGRATVDGSGSAHHDHDHGGDHGGEPLDLARYEEELTSVMQAVGERFGDREPPAAELRAFLHDRLVTEGRTPEDADRFLDDLEGGTPE